MKLAKSINHLLNKKQEAVNHYNSIVIYTITDAYVYSIGDIEYCLITVRTRDTTLKSFIGDSIVRKLKNYFNQEIEYWVLNKTYRPGKISFELVRKIE